MTSEREKGKIRVGHDITTVKVQLYYEAKGKWTIAPRLQVHTFEVILKFKRANGGMASWVAESVIAYDYPPPNLRKTAEGLINELHYALKQRLGIHVRGITKLMISQAYL
jgi:hypothetical protein